MELEVTEMPSHVKGKMAARVKSYKNELARLQRDFVSVYSFYFSISSWYRRTLYHSPLSMYVYA